MIGLPPEIALHAHHAGNQLAEENGIGTAMLDLFLIDVLKSGIDYSMPISCSRSSRIAVFLKNEANLSEVTASNAYTAGIGCDRSIGIGQYLRSKNCKIYVQNWRMTAAPMSSKAIPKIREGFYR